jgi:hypothetical protein
VIPGLVISIFASGDVPSIVTALGASSLAAGACAGGALGSEAQVRLTCGVANPRAGYSLKYYKDGALLTTVSSSQQTHDYTVAGFKEGTGPSQFTSSYVFRVDLVRDVDGAVIASSTAATWAQTYSQCVTPTVSNVNVVNLGTGGCNAGNLTPDTVRVSWSVANADNTNFKTVVTRSPGGVQNGDVNNATTSADSQITGSENATTDFANRDYTYTVEVRRRSDNVVVSSASKAVTFFTGTTCGGEV